MTPVIAQQGGLLYPVRMAATFLRILALLALVMMPFGMAAAPAAAEQPHHAMMAMDAGHSDEGDDDANDGPSASQCAMACSMVTAACPAAPEPIEMAALRPALPLMQGFAGRQPEADPPPPKLA